MKVHELRHALEGVPDDLDVLMRAHDGDDLIIVLLKAAAVESDCDDEMYFALDGNDEEETQPDARHLKLVN